VTVNIGPLKNGDENHGVLRTGDMAKRDPDGFYYIVGRKKRFLKIFGNRVNLDEVEGILKMAGYECVCAGSDDHLKIYMTDSSMLEKARTFISQKTGLNQVAFYTIPIKEIPRNEAGKVLYGKLEELYG
jgi:acyl-CoA synthetase (AMP-forming)/AMP-acid ligase II